MLMFYVNELLLKNNSQQSFNPKNNHIHFEYNLKCVYYSCLIKTNSNTSIHIYVFDVFIKREICFL
jgi:hypothetical protein